MGWALLSQPSDKRMPYSLAMWWGIFSIDPSSQMILAFVKLMKSQPKTEFKWKTWVCEEEEELLTGFRLHPVVGMF